MLTLKKFAWLKTHIDFNTLQRSLPRDVDEQQRIREYAREYKEGSNCRADNKR